RSPSLPRRRALNAAVFLRGKRGLFPSAGWYFAVRREQRPPVLHNMNGRRGHALWCGRHEEFLTVWCGDVLAAIRAAVDRDSCLEQGLRHGDGKHGLTRYGSGHQHVVGAEEEQLLAVRAPRRFCAAL